MSQWRSICLAERKEEMRCAPRSSSAIHVRTFLFRYEIQPGIGGRLGSRLQLIRRSHRLPKATMNRRKDDSPEYSCERAPRIPELAWQRSGHPIRADFLIMGRA